MDVANSDATLLLSGHRDRADECPLSGAEQTGCLEMSRINEMNERYNGVAHAVVQNG
jgi:hypothetical protein